MRVPFIFLATTDGYFLPRMGFFYHGEVFSSTTDLTDECPVAWLGAKQKPNKPLGEDGGRCPDVMLPLWSYKSELLTPKPEAYHHLPSEGHHPRQGDKQE